MLATIVHVTGILHLASRLLSDVYARDDDGSLLVLQLRLMSLRGLLCRYTVSQVEQVVNGELFQNKYVK